MERRREEGGGKGGEEERSEIKVRSYSEKGKTNLLDGEGFVEVDISERVPWRGGDDLVHFDLSSSLDGESNWGRRTERGRRLVSC